MAQTLSGLEGFFKNWKLSSSKVELGLLPSFVHLPQVLSKLKTESEWWVGAQDCSTEIEGAFTGEVSARSLKELGCKVVLIGHSERRQRAKETLESLRKKLDRAKEAGLKPVFCIGETEAERLSGKTLDILRAQLGALEAYSGSILIAYEPVWAIGTGKIPTLNEVEEAHSFVWKLAPKAEGVLYGGSVKAENARELAAVSGVSGFLVGGASLKADIFEKIVESVL